MPEAMRVALHALLKLTKLVANVAAQIVRVKYERWPKMALAVLTCFHGPLVKSSFNIMGDLMGGRNFRMEQPTYSALQTVKYRLGME